MGGYISGGSDLEGVLQRGDNVTITPKNLKQHDDHPIKDDSVHH